MLLKRGDRCKGQDRHRALWRELARREAEDGRNGAVGCIIYSDPRDDGYFQGDVYPNGPFRPAGGVQRGSVLEPTCILAIPFRPDGLRKPDRRLPLAEAETLPKIPVLPISYADASRCWRI